jgi:hypothetical protein
MQNMYFLHPVGYVGHVVHSGASGVRNIDTLFFMLRWDQYGFDKKRTETHHPELVILLPVGSAGHVMHSGPSGARNVDALFFMLGWAQCGSVEKCTGTRYAKLVFCI